MNLHNSYQTKSDDELIQLMNRYQSGSDQYVAAQQILHERNQKKQKHSYRLQWAVFGIALATLLFAIFVWLKPQLDKELSVDQSSQIKLEKKPQSDSLATSSNPNNKNAKQ